MPRHRDLACGMDLSMMGAGSHSYGRQPAEALGMALKQHADIAWPLIFQALARTQAELLSGHGAGQAPGDICV